MKHLGLEPGIPQSRLNRRYGFVFCLEEGLWTVAPRAVSGARRPARTAVGAKDDYLQALELCLSEYLKKSGGNVKAGPVCDLLVTAWEEPRSQGTVGARTAVRHQGRPGAVAGERTLLVPSW